ncbi:MAG: FHA domain-containing protein [Anaerolineae bacterium]|nr:FHA domain-containing protein [Anaerolineae bacterium]
MSNQSSQMTLTVQAGPQVGQVFPLVSGAQTIGRVPGNQIVINHPTISRQHAQITVQPEGVWIQDLGSSNGTFVNGQPITTSTWLKPGDTVQVGTAVVLGVQAAGMPVAQPGQARPAARGGGAGIWVAAIVILLLILVAAGAGAAWYFWPQPPAESEAVTQAPPPGPNVVIYEPAPNAEVQLNEPLLIHASARDTAKVSRAELWVGGQLVATQQSDLPEGLNPFTFAPVWAPSWTGENILLVRAYSTDGRVGESNLLLLNVVASPDSSDAPRTRVIQEGETLADIGQNEDVPVEQIIDLNPGLEEVVDLTVAEPEAQPLPPGEVIVLPPAPPGQGPAMIPPAAPFPPPAPPPPPAQLVLIPAGCDVHLHWAAVPGSAGYRIYRSQRVGANFFGGFLNQVGPGQTSYADPAGNGDWWYAVAVLDAANREIGFTGYRQVVLNNCLNPGPAQQVALELLEFIPAGKDIRCSLGAGPPGAKVKQQNVKLVEGQELLRFPARFDGPVSVRFECVDWGLLPPQIFGSHEKKFYAHDVQNNQVIYRGVGYSLLGGAFEVKYRLCLAPCPPVDKNAPVTTGAPETPAPPPGAFPPPTNLAWQDDPANPNQVILTWDWTPPAGVDPTTVNFRVAHLQQGTSLAGQAWQSGGLLTMWQPQKQAILSKQTLLNNVSCKHASSVIVQVLGPAGERSESELFAYQQLPCPAKVTVNFRTLRVWNLQDGLPGDTTMEVNKAIFFVNQERQEVNLGALTDGTHNLAGPLLTVDLNEKDDVNIMAQLFDDEVEGTANPMKVIWCFPKTVVPATRWVGGNVVQETMRPSAAFIDERNRVNPPVRADCELEVTIEAAK